MEKQTVYKVEHKGEQSFCILFHLKDAFDLVESEIEETAIEDEDYLKFEISVLQMTENEISKLPEFDGF